MSRKQKVRELEGIFAAVRWRSGLLDGERWDDFLGWTEEEEARWEIAHFEKNEIRGTVDG